MFTKYFSVFFLLSCIFSPRCAYIVEKQPWEGSHEDFARGKPGPAVQLLQLALELGRGVNPLPIGDLDAIYERVRGILTLAALVT